jgi:hypothetical protein
VSSFVVDSDEACHQAYKSRKVRFWEVRHANS